MPIASVVDLAELLGRHHLLEPSQLDGLAELLASLSDPRDAARGLVQRGWLTPYQVNQIFQDRGPQLQLGSYLLLDKLGEGGMGQVFKARNWKLGRVVALKLIRKERLAGDDAVRRFHREIRAAAQLSHPNIVHAYDADEVAGTHLFVMEYAEGTDFAKLVKQVGALPVAQACDFMRQAALGLQHAHERGLVHRDIKPANLLLTRQGVVKVLDMGLARLTAVGEDGEDSTPMTREGAVMGTPDYMAPEQAEESHTVDIRADIYSLGCTLYYLLTARVPFPGGTLIQKLDKHRRQEPIPVEQLRPEVTAAVAAILRRMMAKRPADRYQTPADLVRALVSPPDPTPCSPPIAVAASPASRVSPLTEDTVADALNFVPTEEEVQARKTEGRLRRRTAKRVLLAGTVGGAVVLGLVVGLIFSRTGPATRPTAGQGPARARTPPESKVAKEENKLSFEEWVQEVARKPAEKQVAEVLAELRRRNPKLKGEIKPTIDSGVVTGVELVTDHVTDLAPLRALPGLRSLSCTGTGMSTGRISDLTSLHGLKLDYLNLSTNPVSDLRPLAAMPLKTLRLACTKVSDLRPLEGMPLKIIDVQCSPVVDLRPLTGMPLENLNLWWTPATDLAPLRKLPLKEINLGHTKVTDLSDLREMPLETLYLPATPVEDLTPLRGKKLKLLAIDDTPILDLSPIRGMPLETLNYRNTPVRDVTVLRAVPLKTAILSYQAERDAAVLRSIKTLEKINDKPAAEFWMDVDGASHSKP